MVALLPVGRNSPLFTGLPARCIRRWRRSPPSPRIPRRGTPWTPHQTAPVQRALFGCAIAFPPIIRAAAPVVHPQKKEKKKSGGRKGVSTCALAGAEGQPTSSVACGDSLDYNIKCNRIKIELQEQPRCKMKLPHTIEHGGCHAVLSSFYTDRKRISI